MTFKPEAARGHGRINALLPPPGRFVAGTMQLTMVAPTQRNRELVADLSSHCPALGKAKVMGVRRARSADQAGPLGNRPDVIAVANAPRFRESECGLVDACSLAGTSRLS